MDSHLQRKLNICHIHMQNRGAVNIQKHNALFTRKVLKNKRPVNV